MPAAASASPWKVCIWVYHLKATDGASNHQNFDANSIIPVINQHFEGLFEFTVCGTTVINDDRFVQMDIDLQGNDVTELYNLIASQNNPEANGCVRILLSDEVIWNGDLIGGYGYDRIDHGQDASVFVNNTFSEVWSHEIGHYFTLPHTFIGWFSGTQYVNSPVMINGVENTCYQTGDGFCDTPADREGCSNASCVPSCLPDTDPLGETYSPDATLLMSYYAGCRTRFSGEQKQSMRTIYLYHPAYAAIRQPDPQCVFPQTGLIERECPNDPLNPTAYLFEPISGLGVRIANNSVSCPATANQTDPLGHYRTSPPGCNLSASSLRNVMPDKDYTYPLNGVSSFDLVLIREFILGLTPASPYQMIAADANNSGTLTGSDITALRKLILGITDEIPAGSWRFVPRIATGTPLFATQFNDGNPFDAIYDDLQFSRLYISIQGNIPNIDSWMDFVRLDVNAPAATNMNSWSFVGIKVGDVDCTAEVENRDEPVDDPTLLTVDSLSYTLWQGETKTLRMITGTVAEDVAAWQFCLTYPSDLLSIDNIRNDNLTFAFDSNNYFNAVDTTTETGRLRALWFTPDTTTVSIAETVLLEVDVTAKSNIEDISQLLSLSNGCLPLGFYRNDGSIVENPGLTLMLDGESLERANRKHKNQPQGSVNFKVFPLPFSNRLNIQSNIEESEMFRLRLLDMNGTAILERKLLLGKEVGTVVVDGLAYLAPGVYFYEISSDQIVFKGKTIKK
ncbi:MAG: hypothetical protein SFV52_04220 [Saprospiraceae bacterium]|nr:hypothetical protein [Saprospiraceae bacterium]